MGKGQFDTDGYAVLPMFDPELVRAACADISAHIDRLSHALYLPFEKSYPDAPLGQRLDLIWKSDRSHANLLRVAICTDAHRGPRLSALAQAPQLLNTAEALVGCRLDAQLSRVRASIGVFPEHLQTWHSDVATSDGSDCSRIRITAWLPLSDAGPEAGGLELVPGHRTEPMAHRPDRNHSIDAQDLFGQRRVRPPCPAGHALFLDRFTPHRSLPPGADARFALVIWMKAAVADRKSRKAIAA